jgi:hypothetical protein
MAACERQLMPLRDKSSSRLVQITMPKAKAPMQKGAKNGVKNGGPSGTDLSRTLVVDVGGSGIKATLLNDLGKVTGDRLRRDTPSSGMPREVMDVVVSLSKQFESFDRVAVGFPGVIVGGSSSKHRISRTNGRASTLLTPCRRG